MKRKHLLIGLALAVTLAVVGYLIFDRVFPNDPTPSVTGVPTETLNSIDARRTAQAQTKTATVTGYQPADGVAYLAAYNPGSEAPILPAQDEPFYVSCTEARLRASERPEATPEPTVEATAEATVEAGTPGEPDLIRLEIVGAESEACYQVGEIFAGVGEFRVAVGVTKSIAGEIEIDRGNVANSLVGDVRININELRSDEGRRDTAIQRNWIQTNRYPFATLANIEAVGLPTRPYEDGELLTFTVKGDLTLRETTRTVEFEAQARLTGDLLVVTAFTDIKMSDFNIQAPDMAGFVKADDEMRIVLNLVAREKQ
ncbi:hypothetical protein ANRL4_00471 [Anaerolineae bacterium]|nr:hypothetical protein ANRL4_00471 [Anaerolineae bacterium]